jgi:hypothetical protein
MREGRLPGRLLRLGIAIVVLVRALGAGDEGSAADHAARGTESAPAGKRASVPLARARSGIASLFAGALLLAAGASLGGAYAAWGEDALTDAGAVAGSSSSADYTTTDATADTTTAATTEPAPVVDPVPDTTTAEIPTTSTPDGTSEAGETDTAPPPVDTSTGGSAPTETVPPPASAPGSPGPVLPSKHENRQPESTEGAYPTIWLLRALPDPTPPAKRLAPGFARELRQVAAAAGVQWWLVLAVVRARGGDGAVPASSRSLERLADRLTLLHADIHPRRAVLGLSKGDRTFTDQVMALARYDRAVGLRALVRGLESAKPRLERRILRDERIDIYAGGRADIAAHRVNVRILVLVRYLRVTFRQATVSSLFTGHRYFARPGVVSAHMSGLAVDIAGLAWTPISGHQAPNGLTEKAVKAILLLPAELQPQQVISLLGLGGPSFPLADHYDHIHIGY